MNEFEPRKFYSGDTIEWLRNLPDYPSGTWTLKYYLRGPNSMDITATAYGGGFKVSIPSATSATYVPGTYFWQAVVISGTTKHTVATGKFEIMRGLSAESASYDGRSTAKIALDNINAVLNKTATRVQAEYEIEGFRLRDKSTAELLQLRDHFKALVTQEESQQDIESGRPGRKKILTRFV